MLQSSSAVPAAGPTAAANPDAANPDRLLLLVAEEGYGAAPSSGAEGDAHAELVLELSRRAGVEASLLPAGAQSHAALGRMMADSPACVVAVPLALGANDPLLARYGALLRWASAWWPEVPLLWAAPVGAPEDVPDWAARRVQESLAARAGEVPRAETAVIVVGPGGAPPAANAEFCALARLLWEQTDYGLVETAFLDDGRRPSVAARIAHCRLLGMRRVVLLPMALVDGPLARAVRGAAARHGVEDIEVVVSGPLLTPAAAAAIARERYLDAVAGRRASGRDAVTGAPSPGAAALAEPAAAPTSAAATFTAPTSDDLLPPRYRGGQAVSAAPMRSAALQYDDDGQVAWNRVWQSFCNLALAGGPPHRGTLLEPALREEVLSAPADYARVVAEIARGLSLITRLPVVTDGAPGWVGVVCPDEEMAIWMLRAITVENISVRREGATLFLPAAPGYRVEKEIKNVITSVAKTHHYWTEHRSAR